MVWLPSPSAFCLAELVILVMFDAIRVPHGSKRLGAWLSRNCELFPKTVQLLKQKLGWQIEQKKHQELEKLAQHTTPIAKTHGTAMLFASEPTENLKMLINVRHRNITNHDQNITAASPPSLRHQSITDTEQRHHQHKTKASSTYHQNITTQSLHITETRPRHHQHIP